MVYEISSGNFHNSRVKVSLKTIRELKSLKELQSWIIS